MLEVVLVAQQYLSLREYQNRVIAAWYPCFYVAIANVLAGYCGYWNSGHGIPDQRKTEWKIGVYVNDLT